MQLPPPKAASNLFANTVRFRDAYHTMLRPLCRKVQLPPLALDILLFFANNPGCDTASDVCRCRGLKPTLVSFHVDRLVSVGLLERRSVAGDRRKTSLVLTPEAMWIVNEGRALQQRFSQELTRGLSADDLEHLKTCIAAFDRNIDRIRAGALPPDAEEMEEPHA